MFLRFACAVVVVALISFAGTTLESRIRDCRQQLNRQAERMVVLKSEYARLRFDTRQLGAPARLLPPATAAKATTPTRR
ncbi:MAG: hypothetical protein VB859_15910 [Planctomycetaceae bacterium]